MLSFLITLTCFPKPWCTMEITHPSCTQRECGSAEGHTTPLAFRAALQVLSCWIKEAKSGSQGSVVTCPEVGGAALCLHSQVLCWHKQDSSDSHRLGQCQRPSPRILAGMTSLLLETNIKHQCYPLIQMPLGIFWIVQRESVACAPSHDWEMGQMSQVTHNSWLLFLCNHSH